MTGWISPVIAPAMALSVIVGVGVLATPSPVQASAAADAIPDPMIERGKDRIILRDTQKVVEGRVLELDDATVKMQVEVAGIKAIREFRRSNVVSIEYGAALGHDAKDMMADEGKKSDMGDEKKRQEKVYDDTAKVYLVELEGNFGQHISQTPVREMFEVIDEAFDDLIWDETTRTYVVDPAVRDKHIVVMKINNSDDRQGSYNGVFRAEDIYPIIENERIRKGRRVVSWVEFANGGAAFLALTTPEIYMMKNAQMLVTDDLEDFSFGDEMVQEKQISLRMGHMVGAVLVGGYEDASLIVPSMTRSRNWLSVRFAGGKAILTDMEPPDDSWLDKDDKKFWSDGGYEWEVLTDNGMGEFEDDEASLFRNDQLGLDAGLAGRLGISDGVADSIDDILYALEVEDNYVLFEDDDAQDVLDDWSEGIERALDLISPQPGQFGRVRGKLRRELNDIQITGDWAERNAARGQIINIHKQMISILNRYEEAFDPMGSTRSNFRQVIDQIRLQQQDDPKPVPQRQRGRR